VYSIDINFLKDPGRADYTPEAAAAAGPKMEIPGKAALIAGAAVGLAFPLLVGAAWVYFDRIENPRLEAERDELQRDLDAYLAKQQEFEAIQAEIGQIDRQTKALVTVFDRLKPWSALLQDLRDRTPAGVRIDAIAQLDPEDSSAPAEEGATGGPPTSIISIKGIAGSFNDVNDLMLAVQESPFFQSASTRLISATLTDHPSNQVEATETRFEGDLGEVVEYEIRTRIADFSATELLSELRRKGALGLTNRIQQLQNQGVL